MCAWRLNYIRTISINYYASPFFFEKFWKSKKIMTQCCVWKVMCVTLSTLYISYVRMHMATLQYLLQEIFMLMSSCISTIERMFLMNFSIRNYSSCPIIGKSHNICVLCSCPWAVPFSFFFCSHFWQLALYKSSSLTGAFFMHVETTFVFHVHVHRWFHFHFSFVHISDN